MRINTWMILVFIALFLAPMAVAEVEVEAEEYVEEQYGEELVAVR